MSSFRHARSAQGVSGSLPAHHEDVSTVDTHPVPPTTRHALLPPTLVKLSE
jgi:hypothetical protein